MRGTIVQLFNIILVAELLFGVGLVVSFGFFFRQRPEARPLILAGVVLAVMGAGLLVGNSVSYLAIPASVAAFAVSIGVAIWLQRGFWLHSNGLMFPAMAVMAGLALMFFAQGRISQGAMVGLMVVVGLATSWFIASMLHRVFGAITRNRAN